jgi:6-phosphofructokinase 1
VGTRSKNRIGLLTGGGDCPGLNAAIRAVTKTAIQLDYEVIGFIDGFEGLIEGEYQILDRFQVSGIIDRGGTILGSSGLPSSYVENRSAEAIKNFETLGLEAVVVIGGNTSISIADGLSKKGLSIVGIPKTIDNDVKETDYTIGFQTAVQIANDALDRLRSTAESHHRVMILEVMGRDTGWIATYAGLANGADAILIPELPPDIGRLCHMLGKRSEVGKRYSIVIVAEGTGLEGTFTGEHGRVGGAGQVLESIIRERTGLETRTTILGHVQRGGTPVAYDRSLAIALGVKATELVGNRRYGEMAALRGSCITSVPLERAADGIKTVSIRTYKMAEKFFE